MITMFPMSGLAMRDRGGCVGAQTKRALLIALVLASPLMAGCQTPGHSTTAPATTARAAAPTTANVEARATPEAALRAYLGAFEARDRERLKLMVLLPADPERRRFVLETLDKALFPQQDTKILESELELDGPVAVAQGKMRMPDGSIEEGAPMFFVKRDGRWYFVIDMFEGGGLTQEEMEVIDRYM